MHQHPRTNTVTRVKATGVTNDKILRTDLCDPPGVNEWDQPPVTSDTDQAGDDHIDIVLTKGDPNVVASYVHGNPTCS